jgi:hypothetical protein
MATPLYQVQALCLEKGVAPIQGLLLAHAPVLDLAQAAAKGVMQTIMSPMMTAMKAVPSIASIHTQMTTMTGKSTIPK